MKRSLVALALAAVALLGIAGPASAAHESNNKASITGTDPDVTGSSLVNYSKGQGTFNAKATVSGLLANTTYTFRVNGPAGPQEICDFTTDASGSGGCGEKDLDLGGFASAEIVKDSIVVARGTYDRRGACRDKEGAGTSCQANNTPARS